MKESEAYLGALALGYMWNQPLQQLNRLLGGQVTDTMSPDLISGLNKLSMEERMALKSAITTILADEVSHLFGALDAAAKRGEILEIAHGGHAFTEHIPPWNDRLSYFDREGNPKAA